MLRATALAVVFILLLLLPAVAVRVDDIRRNRKEELEKDTSEAFRAVKEHVREMKEELVDNLREKGVEFKKGVIEGESDTKYVPLSLSRPASRKCTRHVDLAWHSNIHSHNRSYTYRSLTSM